MEGIIYSFSLCSRSARVAVVEPVALIDLLVGASVS